MKIAVVLSGYFSTIRTNDINTGRESHKKITNFFKVIASKITFGNPSYNELRINKFFDPQ